MSASPARRPLRSELSERDLAVVRFVAEHRFLTAKHVESLAFWDHASPLAAARVCRRVLLRLTREGLLARLERRVGGVRAGSASYVYGLRSRGIRLLTKEGSRITEPSWL